MDPTFSGFIFMTFIDYVNVSVANFNLIVIANVIFFIVVVYFIIIYSIIKYHACFLTCIHISFTNDKNSYGYIYFLFYHLFF